MLQTRTSHHPVSCGCEIVHRPASPFDAVLLCRNRYARRFRGVISIEWGFSQGVMISHSAVISEVAGLHAFLKQISYGSTITQDDVVLSYLPLAHIFDRCALLDPRCAHSWYPYEKNCPLREGARLLLHQLP